MSKDYFGRQAAEYAVYRPRYPDELLAQVFQYAQGPEVDTIKENSLAIDLATGSGQVAIPSTKYYSRVIGIDQSPKQLQHAVRSSAVEYRVGNACDTKLPAGCADLVTCGQAAHWFDLPTFFNEAARLLKPNGTLSILGYGVCSIQSSPSCQRVFAQAYRSLDRYWGPCNRNLLDAGFAEVQLPSPPFVPAQQQQRFWVTEKRQLTVSGLIKYIRTWSAYQTWLEQHRGEVDWADELENQLVKEAGGVDQSLEVRFPFFALCTRKQ